VTSTKDSTDTP